jgi:hypothetical protein
MNKKVKIGLAIGSTIALAVIGLVIYKRVSQRSATARKYLEEVDENGGNPPQQSQPSESETKPFLAPTNKFPRKNLTLASKNVVTTQLTTDRV